MAQTRRMRAGGKHATKKSKNKSVLLKKVFKGREFHTGINAVVSKNANAITKSLPALIEHHSSVFSKYPQYETLSVEPPDEDSKLYYIQELREMTQQADFKRDERAKKQLVKSLKDIFRDKYGPSSSAVNELASLFGSVGLGAPNKPFRPLAVAPVFKAPKKGTGNIDDLLDNMFKGLSLGRK